MPSDEGSWVLFPVLALTLAFDVVGDLLWGGAALYEHVRWANTLSFVSVDRYGLGILLCNALNLQDAYCGTFGSNGPLWSLT